MKDLGELKLLSAEVKCENSICVETGMVCAIWDQYTNMQQLKVQNYKESLESSYQDRYQHRIDEQQECLVSCPSSSGGIFIAFPSCSSGGKPSNTTHNSIVISWALSSYYLCSTEGTNNERKVLGTNNERKFLGSLTAPFPGVDATIYLPKADLKNI